MGGSQVDESLDRPSRVGTNLAAVQVESIVVVVVLVVVVVCGCSTDSMRTPSRWTSGSWSTWSLIERGDSCFHGADGLRPRLAFGV